MRNDEREITVDFYLVLAVSSTALQILTRTASKKKFHSGINGSLYEKP